jgi:hypothetical protein
MGKLAEPRLPLQPRQGQRPGPRLPGPGPRRRQVPEGRRQILLDQLQEQDGKLAIEVLARPERVEDFAGLTRRYGIEVIAEKVEAERQIVDILDLDIGYGQGHLFGEPRAIRTRCWPGPPVARRAVAQDRKHRNDPLI